MDKTKQISDEKYEGPSKTIIALGKAKAYGWAGSILGGVIGAIAAGAAVKEDGAMVSKATKAAEDLGWHIEGKTSLRAGGAFLGWMIGHYTGMVFGLNKGLEGAGRGKEQYEHLKAQRDQARAELKAHMEKDHHHDAEAPNTEILAAGRKHVAAIQSDTSPTR